MSLYLSGYAPRGVRKSWDRTSLCAADAEGVIRRKLALKPEVHVTEAVAWWRDDGSLAVMAAILTGGLFAVLRQSGGSFTLEFERPDHNPILRDRLEKEGRG